MQKMYTNHIQVRILFTDSASSVQMENNMGHHVLYGIKKTVNRSTVFLGILRFYQISDARTI